MQVLGGDLKLEKAKQQNWVVTVIYFLFPTGHPFSLQFSRQRPLLCLWFPNPHPTSPSQWEIVPDVQVVSQSLTEGGKHSLQVAILPTNRLHSHSKFPQAA